MSRIGKQPVDIPAGVTVKMENGLIVVKGPKGELKQDINPAINVEIKDNQVIFTRPDDKKENRSMHGLYRALVNSMVTGVTQGFQKELTIVGVGYRATLKGSNLELNMGYSHPVVMKAPEGITFEVPSATQIFVKGIDKQLVGQVAADIRAVRKPEPYLGKGIRYANEYVRRKEGKSASS